MTIISKNKAYKGIDGKTYFVEQYQEKGNVPFWRYGYYDDKLNISHIISKDLRTRPNLKRLHLV